MSKEESYFQVVTDLRRDTVSQLIVVVEHGGNIADAMEFKRFLYSLPDGLSAKDHKRIVRAYLALLELSDGPGKDALRNIIGDYARVVAQEGV